MRRYRYHGPEPVDVPRLGLVDVQPNQIVEVEDPEVADGLDGQTYWTHVPDKKRSQAAKKAAAKRDASESAATEPAAADLADETQEG